MERNNSKNYNLLIAIEQIVEKAKDSQLSKDYLRKVAKPLNYMAAELELTKEQSLMLALFINKSDSNSIELSDLSKYLNCSTARLLLYSNDIEALEERVDNIEGLIKEIYETVKSITADLKKEEKKNAQPKKK